MRLHLLSVVERAWMSPFMTKSDYARDNADLVAAAASGGLITTLVSSADHGRRWRPTPEGLQLLWKAHGLRSL